MGKDRATAASEGTKEITFAALAATLAVIAIFMPVAFMTGVIGKFFLQFGVTLSVAVAISYVEAITLAPARCAQMLNVSHEKGLVARAGDWMFERLARVYANGLDLALRVPVIVLLIAVGIMGGAYWTMTQLKQEFVPSQDQSRLQIRLTTTVGADLDETDRLTQKAEAVLAKHPEITGAHDDGQRRQRCDLGDDGRSRAAQDDAAAALGHAAQGAPADPRACGRRCRTCRSRASRAARASPIEFSVRGSDWNTLIAYATKLQKRARRTAGSRPTSTATTSSARPSSRSRPTAPRGRGRQRERQRHRDDGQRAGRRHRRSASTRRRGGAWTSTCACSRRSARGRRTSRCCACARRRQVMVPLSPVTTASEQPELQTINHADRAARDPHHRQRRARALAERRARVHRSRCEGQVPAGLRASCCRARARSSATR